MRSLYLPKLLDKSSTKNTGGNNELDKMNYRELLKRYMAHIMELEGTNQVTKDDLAQTKSKFTYQEICELDAIEDEIIQEDNGGPSMPNSRYSNQKVLYVTPRLRLGH